MSLPGRRLIRIAGRQEQRNNRPVVPALLGQGCLASSAIAEVQVRPSLLTPHLRTTLSLGPDRIEGSMPNTLFGLIPLGKKTITQPLKGVSNVSVDTKVEGPRLVMGVLFAMLGIVLLFVGDGSAALAVIAIVLGIALLLVSFRAELIISDASGSKLRVPASFLDRDPLEGFARAVNDAVAG